MRDRKVDVGGASLAYSHGGRGEALVLIHGYPLERSIWDAVVPLLADDFELIIPDLRGFGESQGTDAECSIADYASDLAAVLDSIPVRKAYIVGHSMGGYVALAFIRAFPERVLGLGLVASQTAADDQERKDGRLAGAREIMAEGVGAVADDMAPKLSRREPIRAVLHAIISKQQPRALAQALQAMAGRPDSGVLFSELSLPVVIIHGEADVLIPIDRGRAMHKQLPAAHYLELASAGHMPMLEESGAVASALRFLMQ